MPPDRMAMAAVATPAIHLEGNVPSFPLHCGKRFGRPAAYTLRSRSRPGRRYRPTAWQWRRIALQQRLQYALRVRRLFTLRILSGRSIHLEGNVPSFPLHCGKRFGRPAAYIEVTSWQAIPPDRMAMAAHCPPATPAMRVACPTAVHAENSERSQHSPGGKRAIVSTSLRQALWLTGGIHRGHVLAGDPARPHGNGGALPSSNACKARRCSSHTECHAAARK